MTINMHLTLHLSNDLAAVREAGREAAEYLAIEGYRSGTLTHFQASQLLGLSRFQFDGFLKDRHIHDHACDVLDFVEDSGSPMGTAELRR